MQPFSILASTLGPRRRPALFAALTALAIACATDTGEIPTETPPAEQANVAAVTTPVAPIAAESEPSDVSVAIDAPAEDEQHATEESIAAPEPQAAPPRTKLAEGRAGLAKESKRADGGRAFRKPSGASPSKSKTKGPAGFGGEATASESYAQISENELIATADDSRSTFSIDVDTASYSNVRRFLSSGSLPPQDSVRIEELVNYFDYEYAAPTTSDPFSMTAEVSECPWDESKRLVHVGLQGQFIDQQDVPARNLVFLFDVSGSMNSPDKLPLLQRAFALLVENLRPEDKVSIVVYAGASGVVLEPTSGKHKRDILAALEQLQAGGSTNGGEGIELAYKLADKNFAKGGINRVILATDGDFNVGTTSQGDLVRLIEDKRKSGVFLSVFGFGSGNLKDSTMESLADKGNGNYAYIDSIAEARKVLVQQAGATLVTIAKDVKIQVEFNPTAVSAYRLIGYENRKLAHADFNDDTKDAGEIGAGHSVTALYEIVPAGGAAPAPKTDELKYRADGGPTHAASTGELMTVSVRYKQPSGHKSKLLSFPVVDRDSSLRDASRDFRFAASVAGFGLLLRDSTHKGDATWASIAELAKGSIGKDPHGHRTEFLALIDQAAKLTR